MLCDNDEESTQRQIQEDVMKGYKALQKEVTDSTSSHCDETIESNELSWSYFHVQLIIYPPIGRR